MSELQPMPSADSGSLLNDLKALIDQARQQVSVTVNAGLTLLYWQVGQRIRKDLLREEDRAAYGKKILATLSQELTQRYGKGFTESALKLERKLHKAVASARGRLALKPGDGELGV